MVYKIAVFGSAISTNKIIENIVFELGKQIAKNNCILITGGCGGYPLIAAKGSKSIGGKNIAYSPAINKDEHIDKYNFPTEAFDDFVFVPKNYKYANDLNAAKKYRNISSCINCDAAIIVSGRIGTLNEFTNLYDFGKIIGVLENTEGITLIIRKIIKIANKKTNAKIIYDAEPKILINKIINELKKR